MKKIFFSSKWDKLSKERFFKGATFTTIRKYTTSKYSYYLESAGESFAVILKGVGILGIARLINVQIEESEKIRDHVIKSDTYPHYTRENFEDLLEKFYGARSLTVIVLTFKILEVSDNGRESEKERLSRDIIKGGG